jgi:prepilin-type N-terminal cleavage/methylation domain-containing protein
MRSSAIHNDRRDAGFSLLEVVIATAILSTVLALALATFNDGAGAAKALTADADLRAKANRVLEQLARELRSSQPGQVSASASAIAFYTITGTSAAAPTFSAARATYGWTPADANLANLNLSRLSYRPPVVGARSGFLTGEVESFTVTPVAASFPNDVPLTLDIAVTLRRDRVVPADTANPKGSIRVTARTKVTVPRGE